MGLAQEANSLGPPAIKVVGFLLWIHGRQFPESQSYWDGNWLNVTAHCGGNGASVWASGAILMVSDLARWVEDCEALYQSGQGEARLQPLEPNLFVTLQSSDRLGHILMRVDITPDHMTQEHRMDFEIDQSYLPSLMAQCRAVIEEYPIRGQAGG
jgi:hypothetical protein